jgi:hypothetical protein
MNTWKRRYGTAGSVRHGCSSIGCKEKRYRIVLTLPGISSKEPAERIKGVALVRVEHLTDDEILSL